MAPHRHPLPGQGAWNFQFESLRSFVTRTNLSSNEKAFLTALISATYGDGQAQDGQTFSGGLAIIGKSPYLRRSLNTTRDIKKLLVGKGLLAVTTAAGEADSYCINWDRVLDLPMEEVPDVTPPQSSVGPLQLVPSTPPVFGGHPSSSGRGTPPILEGTPPKAGGVAGGVASKNQVKNAPTPPILEGSREDMSMSVLNTKRQRHVQAAWWPRDIQKRDLKHPTFVLELWQLAVKNGWYTPTPDNRRNFFAHASRCCSANNPGAAFTANVRARRLFSRAEDQEWARIAIEGLEQRAEPFDAGTLVEQQTSKEAMMAALTQFAERRQRK